MSGTDVSGISQLLGHKIRQLDGVEMEHSFPVIELFSFGIHCEAFLHECPVYFSIFFLGLGLLWAKIMKSLTGTLQEGKSKLKKVKTSPHSSFHSEVNSVMKMVVSRLENLLGCKEIIGMAKWRTTHQSLLK